MAWAESDGGRIWYEVEGSGEPLLLLHGLGGDLSFWDADLPALVARHRVIRMDVRGFGRSSRLERPGSTTEFARDVVAVLDACGVAVGHVLGFSMGGVIAQQVALSFPDRVKSLLLVSTSSEVGEAATRAWRRLADRIEREGFDARTADARRGFSPGFVERFPERVAEVGRRNAAADPFSYASAARAVSAYHFTQELAALRVPTLILQGLEDQLTPPGGSVRLSRAIPFSTLLFIPEAGHNLSLEQPERFRYAILGFLGGLSAVHRA